MIEHTISIIASMFKNVQKQELIERLYFKFIESDFEKLTQLVTLFAQYQVKALNTDQEIQMKNSGDAEQDYMDRLDAGLFTLHQITLILIQLASLQNIKQRIGTLLEEHGYDFETLDLISQGMV